MGWTIRVLGFNSWRGLGIFLFVTTCRPALGLTQPPIQWVQGVLPTRVKRLVHEADHSPPSSTEGKNTIPPLPLITSWHGAQGHLYLLPVYGWETWFLTPGEEHRCRVFKNRVLEKTS